MVGANLRQFLILEKFFTVIMIAAKQYQITQENIVVTTDENVACDPKAREILKSEFTVYIEVSTSVQAERMSNYRPLLPVADYSALLDGLQKNVILGLLRWLVSL